MPQNSPAGPFHCAQTRTCTSHFLGLHIRRVGNWLSLTVRSPKFAVKIDLKTLLSFAIAGALAGLIAQAAVQNVPSFPVSYSVLYGTLLGLLTIPVMAWAQKRSGSEKDRDQRRWLLRDATYSLPNTLTLRYFIPRALFIDGDELIRLLRAAIDAEKPGQLFAAAARGDCAVTVIA